MGDPGDEARVLHIMQQINIHDNIIHVHEPHSISYNSYYDCVLGGSVELSVNGEGHSNSESSESKYKQIIVSMESSKVTVWAVIRDGVTYIQCVHRGELWVARYTYSRHLR